MFFCELQPKFMLNVEAWDFVNNGYNHEIDVIEESIPFEEAKDKVNSVGIGANGIGWFNYSYRVQNLDTKNGHECSIDPVVTTDTNSLPTSCTCNECAPIHSSTKQPLEESSATTFVTNPLPTSSTCIASVPADNSTDQPLACVVSSSSLWALIAVVITLLIGLFFTIIIAICIVRNLSMKLKETKERNSHDSDGEHTCPVKLLLRHSKFRSVHRYV